MADARDDQRRRVSSGHADRGERRLDGIVRPAPDHQGEIALAKLHRAGELTQSEYRMPRMRRCATWCGRGRLPVVGLVQPRTPR
jgi:hypothetical protein